MDKNPPILDYGVVGFDNFLQRSIGNSTASATTAVGLSDQAAAVATPTAINFDASSVSGNLGDTIKVGNITIDGTSGKISIYDTNGNEVARFGDISDV